MDNQENSHELVYDPREELRSQRSLAGVIKSYGEAPFQSELNAGFAALAYALVQGGRYIRDRLSQIRKEFIAVREFRNYPLKRN